MQQDGYISQKARNWDGGINSNDLLFPAAHFHVRVLSTARVRRHREEETTSTHLFWHQTSSGSVHRRSTQRYTRSQQREQLYNKICLTVIDLATTVYTADLELVIMPQLCEYSNHTFSDSPFQHRGFPLSAGLSYTEQRRKRLSMGSGLSSWRSIRNLNEIINIGETRCASSAHVIVVAEAGV